MTRPDDLAAHCIREVLHRVPQLDPAEVGGHAGAPRPLVWREVRAAHDGEDDVRLRAEVLSGHTCDREGRPQALSPADWEERRGRLDKAGTPFFVWASFTHMHLRTHTKPESEGQAGPDQSSYHDTMIDHDKNVGTLLDLLDELGIADNTLVIYSTDNGPHMNSWPDGAMTPFRSEKNTNWEGAFRIPLLVRWPGKIKQGQISNEIVQHHDWFPTFLAMAGDQNVADKLKQGYEAIGRTYKNHIDGYNLLPFLTGQEEQSPRNFFMYLSDDGDVLGLRYDNWKVVFMEQRCHGTMQVWAEPFTRLRVPKFFNLRTDPYERADQTSNTYWQWLMERVYILYGAQALAARWAATFKDFPPIQKPNTFTLDEALAKMHETAAGMH